MFSDCIMNLFYKRTGGVHNLTFFFFQSLIDSFGDAMGSNYHGRARQLISILFHFFQIQFIDYFHAFFFQIRHNLFVMDDRSKGINLFSFLYLRINHLYRSLYPKAKSCCFCQCYHHTLLPFARVMISCTTSSMVISDEST